MSRQSDLIRTCLAVILQVALASGLIAEEPVPRIISRIHVVHRGSVRTAERALLIFIDLKVGQVFDSDIDLADAVEEERHALTNTRYFSDLSIDVDEGETGTDGRIPVVITITIADSWTLLPIPYALPDTQIGKNGWMFGLEVNANNVFGTMTDFSMDSYVESAFGETEQVRSWGIGPELRHIRMGKLMCDARLRQSGSMVDVTTESGLLLQCYSFFTTRFGVAAEVEIGRNWTVGAEPAILFNYGYDWISGDRTLLGDSDDQVDDLYVNREDPFSFLYRHFVRLGDVNWESTFRRGYELELRNTTQFNVSRAALSRNNEFLMVTDMNLSASWHVPFARFFQYATKAQMLTVIGENRTGLGEDVRGVENASMTGDMAFFWQNTFIFQPHRPNTRFNVQIHPFVDVGTAFRIRSPDTSSRQPRIGMGTELVFLLGGVDLRGYIGLDPVHYHESGFLDLGFSTGLSY